MAFRWTREVAIGLAGVLLLAAAQAAVSEIAPVIRDPQTDASRHEALVSGEIQPAYSTYSHKVVLSICTQTLLSPYARLQPAARTDALLDACGALAAAVVASTPSSGFGWLVAGIVAARRGDVPAALAVFRRSAASSLNEYWLAHLRSIVVEDNFGLIGTGLADEQRSDLILALQGTSGRQELAERYWRDEASRERLTAAGEQLSPEQQQLFLAAVRAARPPNAR